MLREKSSLTPLSVGLPLDGELDKFAIHEVHDRPNLLRICRGVPLERSPAGPVGPVAEHTDIPVHRPVAVEIRASTDGFCSQLGVFLPVTVVLLCFGHAFY